MIGDQVVANMCRDSDARARPTISLHPSQDHQLGQAAMVNVVASLARRERQVIAPVEIYLTCVACHRLSSPRGFVSDLCFLDSVRVPRPFPSTAVSRRTQLSLRSVSLFSIDGGAELELRPWTVLGRNPPRPWNKPSTPVDGIGLNPPPLWTVFLGCTLWVSCTANPRGR